MIQRERDCVEDGQMMNNPPLAQQILSAPFKGSAGEGQGCVTW